MHRFCEFLRVLVHGWQFDALTQCYASSLPDSLPYFSCLLNPSLLS